MDINSENCNFDRINVGIIRLDSMNSIVSYVRIAQAFSIPFSAMVDKDFLSHSICRTLCVELGITYQTINQNQLVSDLKSKNIVVNTTGEIEDLFPDQDIANASGKSLADVQLAKSHHMTKTSDAFKEVFGTGKSEYSIKLADYYIDNNLPNPLEDLIHKFYAGNISGIVF